MDSETDVNTRLPFFDVCISASLSSGTNTTPLNLNSY